MHKHIHTHIHAHTAPGVQLLLWKLTKKEKYKKAAEGFVSGAISTRKTPKGLAYWDQWGRYESDNPFFTSIYQSSISIDQVSSAQSTPFPFPSIIPHHHHHHPPRHINPYYLLTSQQPLRRQRGLHRAGRRRLRNQDRGGPRVGAQADQLHARRRVWRRGRRDGSPQVFVRGWVRPQLPQGM
jgi:hypothetical protein